MNDRTEKTHKLRRILVSVCTGTHVESSITQYISKFMMITTQINVYMLYIHVASLQTLQHAASEIVILL
jgi:hypothetical protein